MRFPKVSVADPMGEVFSKEDFECLAYNIYRSMRKRKYQSQPLRVAELGTWSGQSTLAIARPSTLVYCISNWTMDHDCPERLWLSVRGDTDGRDLVAFLTFVENIKGVVFRKAMPVRCNPHAAWKWWPEKLDALFINCDHDGPSLRHLVTCWSRHILPGGNIYGLYKRHTVEGLTGLGYYGTDGTIWRHRVLKEYRDAVGKEVS